MPCNKSFESLSKDELSQIEAKMLPGRLSQSGFLKEGDSLLKIYQDDKNYLDEVKITYDQIADILEYYHKIAERLVHLRHDRDKNYDNYYKPVEFNNYEISQTTWMGAQTCPFQEPSDKNYYGYRYGDTDVTILNLTTNKSITFNTLLPHMIRYHHFFESPNVLHRVNPKDIIDFFNLQPGVDYSPVYVEEKYWAHKSSCGMISDDEIMVTNVLKKMSVPEFKPYNDTSIFLTPFNTDEIYNVGFNLDENDDYGSIRRKILESGNKYNEKHNEKYKNSPSLCSTIYTDNEISQMIKNELELLLEFKKNGTLETKACKMGLYCLSYSSYDMKVDVAGIKYKVDKGYCASNIGVYKYVNN